MEQTQKPKNFILGMLSKTKYIIITAVVLFISTLNTRLVS